MSGSENYQHTSSPVPFLCPTRYLCGYYGEKKILIFLGQNEASDQKVDFFYRSDKEWPVEAQNDIFGGQLVL